jgi:ubiquinone/menaquinone biosynthesis C-methylase UbiE
MTPDQYDAWYYTARGQWIGETEFRLISTLLESEPGSRILEVGCGTGYFTRRFAGEGHEVTGLDPDPVVLSFARAHRGSTEDYVLGDGRRLPFSDREFDYCISITALCFIPEERLALGEMVRVSRRGLALGLLNRWSLLYLQKGRHGGRAFLSLHLALNFAHGRPALRKTPRRRVHSGRSGGHDDWGQTR